MARQSLLAHAGELTSLPPAEAARVLEAVLHRVEDRSAAIAEAFASELDASSGWFAAVCPLLFGIRLASETARDTARHGAPKVQVRDVDVGDEERTVARVFPTRAWHRALLPTTTGEAWLASSSSAENVQVGTSRSAHDASDARVMLVDGGTGIAGILHAVHHVLSARVPVQMIVDEPETSRVGVLDAVLEPLVEGGWLERARSEDVEVDVETTCGFHLGPGVSGESALAKRAADLGLLFRDAGGLTPLVVLPYVYERKELLAIVRWVVAQHRSPMPWLGRRLLVLPGGWRQADVFGALLRDALGEDGLRPATMEEVVESTSSESGLGPTLPVLTVGSRDPEVFLDAAAGELAPIAPPCTAFAVDPLYETDEPFTEMLQTAWSRWPSTVLAINHTPEISYSLTSLPWPVSHFDEGFSKPSFAPSSLEGASTTTTAHNGARLTLDHVDRVVVRRRLWPYPRPPWEHDAPKGAARSLASFLANPGAGRWAKLLWSTK